MPAVADDGSVRLVCSNGTPVAGEDPMGSDARQRALAFDARGQALLGWPVDLDATSGRLDQRLIGDRLIVVAHAWTG